MRSLRMVVGLALALTLITSVCAKSNKPAAGTPSAPATIAPEANLRQLETGMNSAKLADQALVLAPELRPAFNKQGKPALPAGTKVKVIDSTFQSTGDYGHVDAEVSGRGKYTLILIRRDGKWFVIGTEAKK